MNSVVHSHLLLIYVVNLEKRWSLVTLSYAVLVRLDVSLNKCLASLLSPKSYGECLLRTVDVFRVTCFRIVEVGVRHRNYCCDHRLH